MIENQAVLEREEVMVHQLPTESVMPNPRQPRRHFEPMALVELATSIKQYGLMQPITVRHTELGYELVAGERRLRAAKLAELAYIPAIVLDITNEESAILAMVENLQRQDLNYIEEAEGYNQLIIRHNFTQDDLARKLGRSQSTIANKMRILRLPDIVKKRLISNALSERHARALLRLEKDDVSADDLMTMQLEIVERVIKEGLTVSKTEALIDQILRNKNNKPKNQNIKSYIKDIRIFTNTIKSAVDTMVSSGVNAKYDVEEREGGCTISILVEY